MPLTTHTCDRCSKVFNAYDIYTPVGTPVGVGIFRAYCKDGKENWCFRFFRPMEEVLCRHCMWTDPEFLARYPKFNDPKIRKLILDKGMA